MRRTVATLESAPVQAPMPPKHPYLGMWVTEDGDVRHELLPNGRYVEYIPQLDDITLNRMTVREGRALPSDEPGLGIEWDHAAIAKLAIGHRLHKA